jgi:L-fucose isomerase-like protein
MNEPTLAVIFGNRGFFPGHLVREARKDILTVFQEFHINPVMLGENETPFGSVITFEHPKICAELFKSKRESIVGILVVLPNFGDEKGVADTIKLSGLHVPILIQAYPDDLSALNVELRRDAFCGKISLCNNLYQYGYQYTVTEQHTSRPLSDSFKDDLKKFVAVCNVVKGLRNIRVGAIGARPNAFNTVRFSEKILQTHNITVVTADLSELLGVADHLKADDREVKDSLESINSYVPTKGIPSAALVKMAKFKVALDRWIAEQDVQTAMLGFDPKELWHQCMYFNEHDERPAYSQRLRSGCDWSHIDVRLTACHQPA